LGQAHGNHDDVEIMSAGARGAIQRETIFFNQTGDPIQTLQHDYSVQTMLQICAAEISGGERGITRRCAPRPFGAALRVLARDILDGC
jgi:hypothetical protein